MAEALDLFNEVANSPYFNSSSIILFLNKVDIFAIKLKEIPLSDFFPYYTGNNAPEPASEFIKARFTELAADPTHVFTHITCALDTDQIEHVINGVRYQILQEQMKEVTVAID